MKERVRKLTYPTLQHCLRILYTMNGNSKHSWRAIGQKRGYNCSSKDQISISCKNAYIHIMSFITTKFQVILLRNFRGVALTRKTEVSFIFAKFLSSKRALLWEKNGNKISCGYAHLHIMSFITTKFHEILLSGFRGVALTNCVE